MINERIIFLVGAAAVLWPTGVLVIMRPQIALGLVAIAAAFHAPALEAGSTAGSIPVAILLSAFAGAVALVGTLRALDCCSLQSTSKESARPTEAKPRLEIDLGDVQCDIELWDREWREGRARECGFAVAQFHGSGFVPDPPVDEASP